MPKLLLLVDDDKFFHKIVSRCCLKIDAAVELLSAFDGAEGLALLEELASSGGRLPSIVFVDINMPILDGFGFLRGFTELRAKYPALASVRPVAMLTSSDQERDRDLALELGSDHYLVKGATMDEIRESIAGILE